MERGGVCHTYGRIKTEVHIARLAMNAREAREMSRKSTAESTPRCETKPTIGDVKNTRLNSGDIVRDAGVNGRMVTPLLFGHLYRDPGVHWSHHDRTRDAPLPELAQART